MEELRLLGRVRIMSRERVMTTWKSYDYVPGRVRTTSMEELGLHGRVRTTSMEELGLHPWNN